MAARPDFLATAIGHIKESADTPDAEAYISQQIIGGGVAGGGGWQLITVDLSTPGLDQSFTGQRRTVAGVEYEQDPATGIWDVDADSGPNPVDDALAGRLTLSRLSIERTANGFALTGTYPADPAVQRVRVEVDGATNRLRAVGIVAEEPRATLEGLIEQDGGPLHSTQRFDVASYDFDVAPIVVPPLGRATFVAPDRGAAFLVSVPDGWEPIPEDELNTGGGIVFGYEAPENNALILLLDFVASTDLNTLEKYAVFVEDQALAGLFIESSLPVTTLQGAQAWQFEGIDPDEGWHFKRLVYMSPQAVAFNVVLVQGLDELGLPVTAWDEDPALVDFILNSFLVFRGEGF